tara:strand:+ start:714 stop:950 length:237 start_codon:yes stop_codon:yes gene_type:complete
MDSEWIEYKIGTEIYEDYDEENISHREVKEILQVAFRDWQHHADEGPYSPEHILSWVVNCAGRFLEVRSHTNAEQKDN